jgi:sterol desaturase/sphingolipid hydroxylase (fatty acid hydroxylase superfamily)
VSSLPWVIQFFVAIVLADLVEYHDDPVKFFWPIHAVHHSVEYMDWIVG